LDHSSTLTPELKTSVSGLNEESRQTQGTTSRSGTKRELITTARALKALLSNCRVIGITKEEVFRAEKTQKEVWDDADTQVPNNDILKALDF
jgi:fructoselysine-6-P-deglycase FrlB-like protein